MKFRYCSAIVALPLVLGVVGLGCAVPADAPLSADETAQVQQDLDPATIVAIVEVAQKAVETIDTVRSWFVSDGPSQPDPVVQQKLGEIGTKLDALDSKVQLVSTKLDNLVSQIAELRAIVRQAEINDLGRDITEVRGRSLTANRMLGEYLRSHQNSLSDINGRTGEAAAALEGDYFFLLPPRYGTEFEFDYRMALPVYLLALTGRITYLSTQQLKDPVNRGSAIQELKQHSAFLSHVINRAAPVPYTIVWQGNDPKRYMFCSTCVNDYAIPTTYSPFSVPLGTGLFEQGIKCEHSKTSDQSTWHYFTTSAAQNAELAAIQAQATKLCLSPTGLYQAKNFLFSLNTIIAKAAGMKLPSLN